MKVHIQDARVQAVGFLDLEDLDIGMIAGERGLLDEFEPVELAAEGENALADVVQLEVGPEGGIVEGILFLAQLLGVIPPIPGGELEPAALAVDQGLKSGGFLLRLDEGGLPELFQEGVDPGGGLGHVVFQDEGGVVIVAQEARPFPADGDNLLDVFLVVEFVVVVALITGSDKLIALATCRYPGVELVDAIYIMLPLITHRRPQLPRLVQPPSGSLNGLPEIFFNLAFRFAAQVQEFALQSIDLGFHVSFIILFDERQGLVHCGKPFLDRPCLLAGISHPCQRPGEYNISLS